MKCSRPRVLVTTPIEDTWPSNNPALFLGEWCMPYGRKTVWEKMDVVVVPYHWNDREKLRKDYHYLNELYETMLASLVEFLNATHHVSYSQRYWRVLVGPWLGYFLHGTYDKWESLRVASEQYNIESTISLNLEDQDFVPASMSEFFSVNIFNDRWNHYIYSKIIAAQNTITQSRVGQPKEKVNSSGALSGGQALSFRQNLRYIYNHTIGRLGTSDRLFTISTYLSMYDDISLQLKNFQLPKMWAPIAIGKIDERRSEFDRQLDFGASTDFERFIESEILNQIPILYVEGFSGLQRVIDNTPWPKRPETLFTSNALWHDDVTMGYVAKNVQAGARLVYGQHGGFGIQEFSWAEQHERQISDIYLTWGWTEERVSNLAPVGLLKPIAKYRRPKKSDPQTLLMVRGLTSPYIFRIDSDVGLPQLHANINRCLNFAGGLAASIRETNLLVRLYPIAKAFSQGRDSGSEDDFYQEHERWNQQFPSVSVNDGHDAIASLVKRARLVVYTYNGGTGYLEFMAADVPVIAMWDMAASPIRSSAAPFFDLLREAKIVHDSPSAAAAHVNDIWDDVDAWWLSPVVRKARANFLNKYAKVNANLVRDISTILKTEQDL